MSPTPREPGAPRSVFPGFDQLEDDVEGIVRRLSDHRRASGISQADVAERMRTSQSAIARLEANRGDLRLSTLERYARALGLTMQFGVVSDDQEDAP